MGFCALKQIEGMNEMGKKYYHKSRLQLPKEGYWGAFFRMLPALLMVGIVPLVLRQYKHETGLTKYGWFGGLEFQYEFFLASKSVVVMLLFFVMAGMIGVRFWKEKKKIPFLKLLIPLFAYGVLALLSSFASVNTEFSFGGGYEQFESVWVLLAYVFVVYYVFLYAKEELELRVMTDAVCFSATFIGILGSLEGLGIDWLGFHWVQKLITTERFLRAVGGKLMLNFSDGQAVATLYNPNYLGVYGSFMLPFLAMLILYEKSKWRRVWHVLNFVLVAVALLSSRSRAGLIAVVAALFVAVVIGCRRFVKYWYLTIPAINFAVVILLLVNAYNDNLIFDRLKNIFAKDTVNVTEYVAEDGTTVRKTGLTELYTTKESVFFTYNEVSADIFVYCEDGYYGIYSADKNGNQIEVVRSEDGIYTFVHPALEGITMEQLMYDGMPGFLMRADGEWPFIYVEEKGKFQFLRKFVGDSKEDVFKLSDAIMAESVGFEDRQHFFSGRGYIWSRTIPLLKDHIFLGSGPDTFTIVFPQNDYLMMRKMGFDGQTMTKPHSMYLQIGVQTGVLSLICLLVFYGWYAIWSLRLFWFRNMNTLTEGFGVAAFIASIGYMISGISNDSMVVTGPVFWGIMGLGIAANTMVVKKRKEEAGKEKTV